MLLLQGSSQRSSQSGEAGFTLVEVLMALVLLSTALVPAFMLAGNAVHLSERIRNSLIGTNLAQEGVEVVRAIRDANWFAGVPFDTNLTACTSGCAFQYDSTAPLGVSAATPLKLDTVTGLYQYTNGAPTLFSRSVTITNVSAVQFKVQSRVSWTERTGLKTITLEYFLFDWNQ